MRASEFSEGAVYRKKLDPELVQAEFAKLEKMMPREQREAYKPFGSLGKLTSPEQVVYHKIDGSKKHDWQFDYQVAEFTQFMCAVCGKTNRVRQKRR